jgi:O-acetyl-ADP-ribose deacetylase (regulator of RNase III)
LIRFELPPLSIEIAEGDISLQAVDAVVNAANNALWMGSGVAGALKARGGAAVEADAVAQGPIEPGGCVLTGGGRLQAKYVLHAAVMGQDLMTSAALIEEATRQTLALAERHRLRTLAFPALGTGIGGFPLDECARVMLSAVRRFASHASSVRTVRFVLYGERAFNEFAAEAKKTLP